MTEPLTVARPYAKAAFEIAEAKNTLTQWENFFRVVLAIVTQDQVKAWLADPTFDLTKKVSGLRQILGDEWYPEAENFIVLLLEKGRLKVIPEIFVLFCSLKSEYEKKVPVTVTSAYELSKEDLGGLIKMLERKFSKTVELTVEINNSLLGGVIIASGDFVIDHSIRGRVRQLAEALH